MLNKRFIFIYWWTNWHIMQFFCLSGFSFTDTVDSENSRGKDHFLFHFNTLIRSRKFRNLFSTLHVRWLSHIFNRIACYLPYCYSMIFTTLSNYHLTEWWCDGNFSFCTWWFDSKFLLRQFDSENRWTQTRIDYQNCITSEPTNKVC